MIYFLIMYNVIAVLCIVYMIFNFMDVASWLYVNGKNICLWVYNLIKSWIK